MIRAVLIKARDNFKAGDVIECSSEEFEAAYNSGLAISESEHKANETVKASNRTRVTDAVTRAKTRKAIAPKDDAIQAKAIERLDKGEANADVLVEMIDGLASHDYTVLANRVTQFQNDLNGNTGSGLRVTGRDPRDACIRAVECQKDQFDLIKSGTEGAKKATELSRETYKILASEIMPIINKGGDFMLRDLIRADNAGVGGSGDDSFSTAVGTLAGSLVLMRNLGFLKNIINFMPYISTDLRNEPALYNQPVFTRYITPPPVVGYQTPSIQGSSPNQYLAGGWMDSTPSATDVSVILNKQYGVQVTFNTVTLGSTVRNLLTEQVGAQTYSLGEQIVKDFLAMLFGTAWTGVVNSISLGNAFNLSSMVSLKNRATLSKMPPIGRFALMHSTYHDGLLTDANLLTAKSILALINKDASAFESAELPTLYGIKPLESQLASYVTTAVNGSSTGAGVVTAGTDGTATLTFPTISSTGTVTFSGGINAVGFLGNMSSTLMVARIPQDYTQAFPNIPATAAIQVVTDPDSGLSLLNCRYVNHQLGQVSNRLSLMYGFAPGDRRQGIVLTP